MALGIALAMCSVGAACDDGNGEDPDSGTPEEDGGGVEVDSGPGDPDSGPGDPDAGPAVASVSAENQTLELSTVVTIAEVVSEGAGWIVIHEDAGGPGPVIGMTAVPAGTSTNVLVALDRPAETSETLHAMLHVDAGTLGTYEFPGADEPVMVGGMAVSEAFVVTVPDGTPAVRLLVEAVGFTAWNFTGADPDRYADAIGETAENQPLTLRRGWRYEIVNPGNPTHPFQLINDPPGPTDLVQLSQGATDGALESNASIAWNEVSESTFRFTVSAAFETGINAYRCGVHTADMRGTIAYTAP